MCASNPAVTSEDNSYAVPENRIPRLRPTFPEVYMGLALQIRLRSTCYRMAVGAVVVSTDFRYVHAVGYNGNAEGLENGCDSEETGSCGCLHAEENAVINCTVPRNVEKIVFVTHLPCKACAKRFLNLGGVKRIYYAIDYRIKDSLEIFKKKGIETCHLPIASNRDELALLKAAEDMYKLSIVDTDLEKTLIGVGKAFATPFSYQMHMVMKWRDAVSSELTQTLGKQASSDNAPEFIVNLSEQILGRLKEEKIIQQQLDIVSEKD